MSDFTEQQLDHWKKYEAVRKSCRYNMFDPRARAASKLSADEYKFVMRNFSALRDTIAKGESE